MPRISFGTHLSRLVWAAALLSAAPVLAQTVDPMRVQVGTPSGPQARPQGPGDRPAGTGAQSRPALPPAARPDAGRIEGPRSVPPLDNGRSRSPFLRGLDRDTPNLTPRPGETGADLFRAQPDTYGPRPNRPVPQRYQRYQRPGGVRGGSGIWRGSGVMPYYGWPAGVVVGIAPAQAPSQPAPPPEGYLRLRVSPRSSEVFVDGAFAGTADEFGGVSERSLPAGTHRIELRAPGFEPFDVDVRVPANDTLIYRRELRPIDARPAAPAPAALPPPPHKTMYVLPGCYAGDTPPQASQLPARCNLADLRIIP